MSVKDQKNGSRPNRKAQEKLKRRIAEWEKGHKPSDRKPGSLNRRNR